MRVAYSWHAKPERLSGQVACQKLKRDMVVVMVPVQAAT